MPPEAGRHIRNRGTADIENARHHRLTSVISGGRCRNRTYDPFGVNEVRYHCANRPGYHPVESISMNQPSESGQRDSNPRSQPWQGCALPTKLCPHVLPSQATGDKDTPISGKSQAPACPTGFPTIIERRSEVPELRRRAVLHGIRHGMGFIPQRAIMAV